MKKVSKFDRVNGETRKCKECGEEYHTMKPIWTCNECVNKKAFKKNKELAAMGMKRWIAKAEYPDRGVLRKTKFDRLQAKLRKMHFRHEWVEYLSARLDEVMKDRELMDWIYDRRDEESMKQKKVKKYGIDVKKVPSTKNINWDEI